MEKVVRCKMFCTEKGVTNHGGGVAGNQNKVSFAPVIGDSPENKEFFKYTPGGKLELFTVNDSAAAAFEPGKQYYIDITPADQEAR